MTPRNAGALGLLVGIASAFQGTSPLFVLSSSRNTPGVASENIASSSAATRSVEQLLAGCPSDSYVVVSQPGVAPTDFSTKLAAPWLGSRFHNATADIVTSSIGEVVGGVDAESIVKYVEKRCNAIRMKADASNDYTSLGDAHPRVIEIGFAAPPSTLAERTAALVENDSFLHAVMSTLREGSYTLIYTTTPPPPIGDAIPPSKPQQHPVQDYEMDETFPLHTEMKRAISKPTRKINDVALFEKYQFLSPGVFMGVFVSIILFLILYVGITAVAGLEVSYFAFSKEMGPTAQKKQQ